MFNTNRVKDISTDSIIFFPPDFKIEKIESFPIFKQSNSSGVSKENIVSIINDSIDFEKRIKNMKEKTDSIDVYNIYGSVFGPFSRIAKCKKNIKKINIGVESRTPFNLNKGKINELPPTNVKKYPFEGIIIKIPKDNNFIFDLNVFRASRLTDFLKKENKRSPKKKTIVAINGGFWDNNKMPLDWCIIKGQEITPLSNSKSPCIVIQKEHNFKSSLSIFSLKETLSLLNKIEDNKQISIMQTGPTLVYDSNLNYDYKEYQIRADSFDSDITISRHPRSFIGLNNNNYYFGVIYGRNKRSIGVYLEELAYLCKALDFNKAINLDGGASTSLWCMKKLYSIAQVSLSKCAPLPSFVLPKNQRKIISAIVVYSQINN